MSNPLDALLPTVAAPGAQFRWATVTGLAPVRIRFDTETDDLPDAPAMLATVAMGNRVLTVTFDKRVVVLGVAKPGQ